MKPQQLIILFLYTVSAAALAAQTEPVIPESVIHTVQSEGEFVRYFFDEEFPEFIPQTENRQKIEDRYNSLPYEMGVEVYFAYPLPGDFYEREDWQLRIYNILHRISTMEGIEYFSQRRKRMRTFFTEAYIVESMENTKPLQDPVFTEIPVFDSMLLFQEDTTFGENFSEVFYEYSDDICTMTVINKSKMKYVVPVIPEGGLLMTMQIIPSGDSLYFYGICGVDMLSLFGIERKNKESFYNRLKAMYNWFSSEFEKEFP